jgi:ABC-type Mn2+/Zn2+ transport system ATPase subunit
MLNKDKKPAISVENLSYRYPHSSLWAIENLNFRLEGASINLLIGPNGSGKSTLLKAILGLLAAEGKISFFDQAGKNIKRENLQIAYAPQRFDFDPSLPLTVTEFLQLTLSSCSLHHHGDQHRDQQIIQVLALVNAENLALKKLGDLSGGQLQRVVLARALLHQPQILILDEPESGIDAQGEKSFYQLLKKLAKENQMTILIASHQMEIVSQYADQVLCLNKTLVCSGGSEIANKESTYKKLYGSHMHPYHHDHHH